MNEFYSFMKGSAGKMNFENNTLWEEIVNLDQECGNYREVVVEIYFTDRKYIQLVDYAEFGSDEPYDFAISDYGDSFKAYRQKPEEGAV